MVYAPSCNIKDFQVEPDGLNANSAAVLKSLYSKQRNTGKSRLIVSTLFNRIH
jgi:hypothetical protein